jgi:hypothetical protein
MVAFNRHWMNYLSASSLGLFTKFTNVREKKTYLDYNLPFYGFRSTTFGVLGVLGVRIKQFYPPP